MDKHRNFIARHWKFTVTAVLQCVVLIVIASCNPSAEMARIDSNIAEMRDDISDIKVAVRVGAERRDDLQQRVAELERPPAD